MPWVLPPGFTDIVIDELPIAPLHRPPRLKLAVVGDVHDRWSADDLTALEGLGVDLVLFVGDFGNESLDVVRQIAQISLPKAVILGNHDGWYTVTPWGRKKNAPYDRRLHDRVKAQRDLLGEAEVGWGRRDFPQLGLSVVGARPFSWGGDDWKSLAQFYRDRYNVGSFAESAQRISSAALAAPQPTLIFLAHSGPAGLGATPESICGRDWNPLGADFGDPDLASAIAKTRAAGRSPALVTFGHMHHSLRHRSDRTREAIVQDALGTVYLNAAAVPRVVQIHPGSSDLRHNFTLVDLVAGQVERAALVWVDRGGQILSETVWFPRPSKGLDGADDRS